LREQLKEKYNTDKSWGSGDIFFYRRGLEGGMEAGGPMEREGSKEN
jgi:hypothetical protein